MAISIYVGYTIDNVKKVNKSYSLLSNNAISISPLSVIDQLSPVFVIDYNAAFMGANYVIVGAPLNRKYFCTVSMDTAGRMVLSCSCDYLSSFDLSNCAIQVTRNGGIGKPTDYVDTKFPIKPNQVDITSIVKSSGVIDVNKTDGGYLLTVIGGSA